MRSVLFREAEALVNGKTFQNKEELQLEALRALFRSKPYLRIESAVELYKSGEISLSRACEISGLNLEAFKEEISERGISIIVEPETANVLMEGVNNILGREK